jgi:glycosyltransferase involved in cell wall biosynthesis
VINEVFAFTDFIATAVRKVAPRTVKVTKLPFPFIQNWQITKPAGVIREQYNIPSDAFVFIFNFDFFSVYERKNPEAILRAFKLAFSAGENVYLVLKTIHGEAVSETNTSFQVLVNHMVSKDKIVVVNDNLDRNDFMNLINASDCYISLHRSEGLGLGMLEAMSMGKPVIATNFGGNTDFMRQDNSLLVDYSLVAVKENAKPYQPGWLWAEADVQQAADYMLRLVEDRAFANELGKRARESVQKQYGNDVFEKTLNDWIKS